MGKKMYFFITTRTEKLIFPKPETETKTMKAIANESYYVVNAVEPLREIPIPNTQPTLPMPKFGFVENAERINGRFAMLFFIAIFIIEAITDKGILELIGIQTGKGIDIGF